MSAAPRTHVCFGHSARGTLRETLLSAGRDEPVLNFWGQYVAGPLRDCNNRGRSAWLAEYYFGVGKKDKLQIEHAADERLFREALANCEGEIIAWISRRCAIEYCDFLEFLSAVPDKKNLLIVDLSEARAKSGILHLSVGSCWPEILAEQFGSERQLSNQEREQSLSLWDRLASENADLRMLEGGNLISISLDRFDNELLKKVPGEWTIAARIVGNAIGWIDYSDRHVQGYCDLFWFNRLRTLANCQMVEWDGLEGENMRAVRVRRIQ